MSDFTKVMATLERRFQSGNSVPIESTRITKEEFDIISNEIEGMIIFMESTLLKNMED